VPHVEITIGAGRTDQQLRSMIHRVHQALAETVGARPEHIRIVVNEVPRTHWATGDVTLREMDEQHHRPGAVPDPEDTEVIEEQEQS
jgi:4-oxalocrotonate tautomerase